DRSRDAAARCLDYHARSLGQPRSSAPGAGVGKGTRPRTAGRAYLRHREPRRCRRRAGRKADRVGRQPSVLTGSAATRLAGRNSPNARTSRKESREIMRSRPIASPISRLLLATPTMGMASVLIEASWAGKVATTLNHAQWQNSIAISTV